MVSIFAALDSTKNSSAHNSHKEMVRAFSNCAPTHLFTQHSVMPGDLAHVVFALMHTPHCTRDQT